VDLGLTILLDAVYFTLYPGVTPLL
jgi:hypothetical protein